MGMTVHVVSGAPRPWRVLLGLTFKGLDYDINYLQASKREHKSEPFISLNPRGTVPVLEAEGLVLRDSIGILAWLDRAYPDRPLFGGSANEAAAIWQATLESCDYLRAASDGLLRPIFFGGATSKTPELTEAAESMQAELRRLEDLLNSGDFLSGNGPSAADAVSYPEVRLVQRAVETTSELMAELGFQEPLTGYPHVSAWKRRIEALDGFERTLPPHWRGQREGHE